MNARSTGFTAFSLFLCLAVFFITPAMADRPVVRICAAANLTDALKKIGAGFNRTQPEVELQFNFGSSGSLAKQIDHGAPADLFFSANAKWMDHLVNSGKVVKETVRDITGNALVAVGLNSGPLKTLADVRRFQKIAMGSPGSVPVGEYTEQALKAAGIYDSLISAHTLVMTRDVRQALLYADRGETDIAFVYKTDALQAHNAKIVFTVPSRMHQPIVTNMGLTAEGQTRPGARAFYNFMASKEARTVLESYGYAVIAPPPAR